MSIKNFKALVPLRLGVTNKQTNRISFRVIFPLYQTFHLLEDIPALTTTRYLTDMKTRLWLYSQGGWLRWPARIDWKAQPSYQVS